MIRAPNGTHQQNRRILLLERPARRGNQYAAILSSHGYDVHLVGTTEELLQQWSCNRPELVLILCNKYRDYDKSAVWCEAALCRLPHLRVAFLHRDDLFLTPPLFASSNGRQVSWRRGDFLEKMAAIFASR